MGAVGRGVPVLLSLAHQVEGVRHRSSALHERYSTGASDTEHSYAIRFINDICDILAQSLAAGGTDDQSNEEECFVADARSVIGRETSLLSSCCGDLARILDAARNGDPVRTPGKLQFGPEDQRTALGMARLIGSLVYRSRHNQDLLRLDPVPTQTTVGIPVPSTAPGVHADPDGGGPMARTGLDVLLSASSLGPAGAMLRESCRVAVRNATEGTTANVGRRAGEDQGEAGNGHAEQS